jgi:hypothetical protein
MVGGAASPPPRSVGREEGDEEDEDGYDEGDGGLAPAADADGGVALAVPLLNSLTSISLAFALPRSRAKDFCSALHASFDFPAEL